MRMRAANAAPHVLVVDDDPVVRSFIAMVLDDAGFRVSVAGDLDEAVAKASDEDVSVLVSDLVLGCCDGLDVDEAVRTLNPRLQTLYISGYGSSRYGSDADDPILAKPFGIQELVDRVRALLPHAAPA
jgi:DNA-binding response OmpR family regulator